MNVVSMLCCPVYVHCHRVMTTIIAMWFGLFVYISNCARTLIESVYNSHACCYKHWAR